MKNRKNSIPTVTEWAYTLDTVKAADKLTPGTVDEQAHLSGMRQGEPLIVMLDALLQYANVYKVRFEGELADDGVLGDYWLDAVKGLRGLLNGDGTRAMERGITTDSKSNGVCEEMFWNAMSAAGFSESDL